MTTPMRNRLRRHTRPADYVSKSRQAEAMSSGRPGGCAFSFNGEFPDAGDPQPVEAFSHRRNYTSGNHTGGYRAIHQAETTRTPAVCQHGVHRNAALVMLAVFALFLGSLLLVQLDDLKDVQNEIARKNARITYLGNECWHVKGDIVARSDGMNIRQEALRMGLISSRGVQVEYLQATADAVIPMPAQTEIQSLAAIWGR